MCLGVFACVYVCAPHTCIANEGRKRASDPLELELQMVVSHLVDENKNLDPLQKQPVLTTTEPSL